MMGKGTEIDTRFQNILKNILPSIYDKFRLKISYVIKQQQKIVWQQDVVSCGEQGSLYAEHMTQLEYPTDEIIEHMQCFHDSCGEYQYYLQWEIWSVDALPKKPGPVLRELLTKFLNVLEEGFVDCEMFTVLKQGKDVQKENVLKHLFSCVEDHEHFLNMFVDEILHKYGLPEKSILTQLSAQMYEKRPIHGRICFVEEEKWKELMGESSKWVCLDFRYLPVDYRTFCTENLKELRKLLEINTNETIMISSCSRVDGIVFCGRKQEFKSKFAYFPQLIFYGYLKWKLCIEGKEWFSYDNGIYKIYSEGREKQWKRALDKLKLTNTEMADLVKVIELLSEESHGTSVVFMEEDILTGGGIKLGEVDRLNQKNRCIKIYGVGDSESCGINLKLHLKDMKGITSIDGAIMADMKGNVHAIGAILDGEAMEAGNVSRGARYNSVQNYITVIKRKNVASNIFGVIVSEDGDVNLVS